MEGHSWLPVKTCGARFYSPRPRKSPVSFAPTRPDPKSIFFSAPTPTRPDSIGPGPDRTDEIYHTPNWTDSISFCRIITSGIIGLLKHNASTNVFTKVIK